MTFGRRLEMGGGATSIASSANRACLASAACDDDDDDDNDDDELEAFDAHEREVVAMPSLSVTSISIVECIVQYFSLLRSSTS